MKIDNSHLCAECTGKGCKLCLGTGIDQSFKGTPEPEEIEDFTKQKACKVCGRPFMAKTYKVYRRINGVLKWFIYKSIVCPDCKKQLYSLP